MDKNGWISLKERYPDMTEISYSAYSRHYRSDKVLVYTKMVIISLLSVGKKKRSNGLMNIFGIPIGQVDEEWL